MIRRRSSRATLRRWRTPGDRLLSAADAAARLGVKRETLYAYVSRGLLRRRRAAPGRQSWFALADVERLLRERGSRAQHPPRVRARGLVPAGAPDLEIASSITAIDAGRLRYRGHDLDDLLGRRRAHRRVVRGGGRAAVDGRAPSGPSRVGGRPGPAGGDPYRARRAPADRDPRRPATHRHRGCGRGRPAAGRPPAGCRHGHRPQPARGPCRCLGRLLADSSAATALPGKPSPSEPVGLVGEPATVAGRVAAALGVAPRWVDAIDTALVVLADHELATSTLAARVAASTRADPYQVVLAGMAAVSGPLHGLGLGPGRPAAAGGGRAGAAPEAAIAAAAAGAGRRGRLRPRPVPRRRPAGAAAARRRSGRRRPDRRGRRGARAGGGRGGGGRPPRRHRPERRLRRWRPWSAAAGLPLDVGEALFALARMAGWLAHGLEEYAAPPLRYRLRAVPGRALGPSLRTDR